MANITLFAQAIGILPKENVKKIIRKAGTDKYCKGYKHVRPPEVAKRALYSPSQRLDFGIRGGGG